jgi:DNA-directed RNA polymerase subunit RPC12/RpoP
MKKNLVKLVCNGERCDYFIMVDKNNIEQALKNDCPDCGNFLLVKEEEKNDV